MSKREDDEDDTIITHLGIRSVRDPVCYEPVNGGSDMEALLEVLARDVTGTTRIAEELTRRLAPVLRERHEEPGTVEDMRVVDYPLGRTLAQYLWNLEQVNEHLRGMLDNLAL